MEKMCICVAMELTDVGKTVLIFKGGRSCLRVSLKTIQLNLQVYFAFSSESKNVQGREFYYRNWDIV